MKTTLLFYFTLLFGCFEIVKADSEEGAANGLEIFIRTINTHGFEVTFTAILLYPGETRWSPRGWKISSGMTEGILVITGNYSNDSKGFDLDSSESNDNPKLGVASYVIEVSSPLGTKHASFSSINNGWHFTGDKWLVYDYDADIFYRTASHSMDLGDQVTTFETYDANYPERSILQPTVPSGLTITNYNNHPKLIWNASEPAAATKYDIYRNDILVYTTGLGETVWIDENVRIGGGANLPFSYKVIALNPFPQIKHSDGYSNTVTTYGIQFEEKKKIEYSVMPSATNLDNIYPNPFNPGTTIHFSIKDASHVILQVYDIMGRMVHELKNETMSAGRHEIIFNAKMLPSGVYYLAFQNGSIKETKKLILQK